MQIRITKPGTALNVGAEINVDRVVPHGGHFDATEQYVVTVYDLAANVLREHIISSDYAEVVEETAPKEAVVYTENKTSAVNPSKIGKSVHGGHSLLVDPPIHVRAPINNPGELPRNASLNNYQMAAVSTAIYPGKGTALGLAYVALKMNGEAGEFAEQLGKAMRDDAYTDVWRDSATGYNVLEPNALEDERREALIKELGDVLWYISAAASELGVSLDEVAHVNIDKLRDRAARGKLQGSGDNR